MQFLIANILFEKAWTTAGVANNRIIAAMPIILDMVNLRQVIENINITKTSSFSFVY